MNELDEILEIVDEDNNVVGKASRRECYEKALLHRAVNIFLYNSKGQVFLHKRSNKKLEYPSFWDLSCSEHVKPAESFEEAAKRGLLEELGIKVEVEQILPIHKIINSDEDRRYFDCELMVTFKAVFDGKMAFDPGEVSEGKFFDVQELDRLIKSGELKVTPWFLEDWELINN